MASRVDEAERQVREQRRLIQAKLGDLEGRIGDDLAHVRERLQHHVSHAPDLVPGGPRLLEQAEQHPWAAIAGGLSVGVAAGMLTGGGDDDDRGRRNGRSDRGDSSSDGFLGAGLLTMLGGQLASPLRPYVEDAARQFVSGFADRQRAERRRSDAEREEEREAVLRNGS